MRTVLQLRIRGTVLVGTCHVPGGSELSRAEAEDVPGVLLLNSGYLPRAARGDLSVHLGDRLAEMGYPVFRFDLPGLGDSGGELPEQLGTFFRQIQDGVYGPWAMELAGELRRRFKLKRMIVGGNCGGAITAIYAAGLAGDEVCGLVLMEPNFAKFVPDVEGAGLAVQGLKQVKAMRRTFRDWLLARRGGWHFRRVYWTLRRPVIQVQQRLRGAQLPEGSNLPLIRCWHRLACRGMPMLVIQAGAEKRVMGRFDYVRYLGSHYTGHVVSVEIEGANHSFVEGGGKRAVMEHVGRWMGGRFPVRGKIKEPTDGCRWVLGESVLSRG